MTDQQKARIDRYIRRLASLLDEQAQLYEPDTEGCCGPRPDPDPELIGYIAAEVKGLANFADEVVAKPQEAYIRNMEYACHYLRAAWVNQSAVPWDMKFFDFYNDAKWYSARELACKLTDHLADWKKDNQPTDDGLQGLED